ncbi:MAG: MFS transporter [Alphaproteobacteria bacterium]|nr:MFS transporter [Alphaproteobacteria bacterium]
MQREAQSATRWDIVAAALFIGFMAGAQIGKAPPALPLLREELQASLIAAGWIASLFNLSGAFAGFLIGAFADRIGPKRALGASLSLIAAASFLGAEATEVWFLLLTRAVESAGYIGVAVGGPRMIVAAVAAKDRNLAMGIWGTFVPGGMATALFLAPVIVEWDGWRGLWRAAGIGALLGLALLFWAGGAKRWSDSLRTTAPSNPWADAKLTITSPGPWLLGLCFGSYSLQYLTMMAWLPTYLIEAAGSTSAAAALSVATVTAGNVIGNIAAGMLLARGVKRAVLLAFAYLSMAGAVFQVFIFADNAFASAAWAFLFSAIGGLIPGALMAGAAMHAPRPQLVGSVTGLMMQLSNCGQLAGPPILGAILAFSASWQAAPYLNVGAAVLGLVSAALLGRLERRQAYL